MRVNRASLWLGLSGVIFALVRDIRGVSMERPIQDISRASRPVLWWQVMS